MSTVKVNNLCFRYRPDETVLKDLSFEVSAAEFLCIAGPNGAGKSTLLNLLAGLLKPHAGDISIDGMPIGSYKHRQFARKVAVVRQEFVPPFDFSVMETVTMARLPYLSGMAFEGQSDRDAVRHALEVTDTARLAARPISQLSGGERQRVFIARALAQDTPILLLDEPTSFLDLKNQVAVFDLLKKMQVESRRTMIAVTHDINLAAQYCDRILLLGASGISRIGAADEILRLEVIEKAFDVTGFSTQVGSRSFFLPLGKMAKDAKLRHPDK